MRTRAGSCAPVADAAPREGAGLVPERFFFLHLQKTAGTSLLRALRHWFPPEDVYPGKEDTGKRGGTIDVDHLMGRWAEVGDRTRLVAGHFPLCTTELMGGGFRVFTVLREPVERTLSFLRHQKKLDPWAAERTLEEIYSDPFRLHGFVHNHMVKMLAISREEMTHGALTLTFFEEEHLERAQQALEHRVEVFGFQHDMAEFHRRLEAAFGWSLPEPEVTNTTKPLEVDDAFRQRIAEDNALDVRLYRFAQELEARRPG